VNTACDLGD